MIRSIFTAFAVVLMAGSAFAFDLKSMTKEEREAFGAAVRAYLLENPEVIFEAVDIHEQRQAEQQAASDIELIVANASEIFFDDHSWVGGNPDGDITVVEFLDYRCGYCKRAFAEVEELIATDGNIRFVVKEFPILGEQSTLASRFAIAVKNTHGSDAYKAMHDELMNFRGTINIESLKRLAERLLLDFDVIGPAMSAPEVELELAKNYALAQKLSISGTPSFVFQSQMLRGYAPLDAMRNIVNHVRG